MKKFLLLATMLTLLLSASPVEAFSLHKKPKVHRYKVVTADGGESVIYGTHIRTNGVYVEIWLNGRIDTIITAPKYVTELPDEPPKAAEEPADVVPDTVPSVPEQKQKVARAKE